MTKPKAALKVAESLPRQPQWRGRILAVTVAICMVAGALAMSLIPLLTGLVESPSGGEVMTLRRTETPLRFWMGVAALNLNSQVCLLTAVITVNLVASATRDQFPIQRSWYQEIFGAIERWGVWALAAIGLFLLVLWIRYVASRLRLAGKVGILNLPGHSRVERPGAFWLTAAWRMLLVPVVVLVMAVLVW